MLAHNNLTPHLRPSRSEAQRWKDVIESVACFLPKAQAGEGVSKAPVPRSVQLLFVSVYKQTDLSIFNHFNIDEEIKLIKY